jgi:hypothetical protein
MLGWKEVRFSASCAVMETFWGNSLLAVCQRGERQNKSQTINGAAAPPRVL